MDAPAVLAAFRSVAPEFAAVSDDDVLTEIVFCQDFVSEKAFGNFFSKALAFYTAHEMKLTEIAADEGTSSGALAGNVTMEKEGDLQRQYSASDSSSNADVLFCKTLYGRRFMILRDMCILPVRTRMG